MKRKTRKWEKYFKSPTILDCLSFKVCLITVSSPEFKSIKRRIWENPTSLSIFSSSQKIKQLYLRKLQKLIYIQQQFIIHNIIRMITLEIILNVQLINIHSVLLCVHHHYMSNLLSASLIF